MPILNLAQDYNRPALKEGEPERLSDVELSLDYITYALNSAYPQGVEGQLRRQIGRVQRKLDETIAQKRSEVDLESNEIDLLKECFRKSKFNPMLSKYVVVLEEAIEKI